MFRRQSSVENAVETSPSFDRYVESELGWLRTLALQLIADAAAADDAVQETVVAALRRRPALDSGGRARAWLASVLRRNVSYALRGARNRADRERRSAREEAQPAADEVAARAESQRSLADAVFSLSEPYRSVVLLRFFEGLEPGEIAARRGVPAATVRSQLSRALAEMRATLDRRHGGDSRVWCAALLPLAGSGSRLSKGAGLAATPLLVAVVMKHWIALSISAALAAGLFFAVREGGAAGPRNAAAATPEALEAPVEVAAVAAEPSPTPAADRRTANSTAAEAPRTSRAPLRGRVLHEKSRRPLPHFHLELSTDGPDPEQLVTDAEGRFESALERAAGPLVVTLLDVAGGATHRLNGALLSRSGGIERAIAWNGADELELSVGASVTIELRFDRPFGLDYDDFRAELFDVDPGEQAPEAIVMQTDSVVRGDPPFARFYSTGFLDTEPGQKFLRLVSEDGLWSGGAWCAFDGAGSATPVRIALRSTSAIEVEVLLPEGEAASQLSVELVDARRGRGWRREGADLDGARPVARFLGLDPGEYRVVARAQGLEDAAVELSTTPGGEVRRVLAMQRLSNAVAIRGELRSRSGECVDLITLQLTAPGDGQERTAMIRWTMRDGRRVGAFAFEGLRPGPYELQIFALSNVNRAWSPASNRIEAPADLVVFECDDLTPVRALVFEVFDARTGEPLADVDLDARSNGRVLFASDAEGAAPNTFLITEGLPVDWRAEHDGYTSAAGDNSDAVRVGDRWIQTVRLEPAP